MPDETTTLITVVGGYNSNSFITVAEAATLIASAALETSNATHWTALSNLAKEIRLRAAALYIGSLPLRGVRPYHLQALAFPRDTQLDLTVIPDDIKLFQALAAYLIIDPNITATDPAQEVVTADDALVKSVEILGVMKVGLQYPSTTDIISGPVSKSQLVSKSYGATMSILISPWVAQFRGGAIRPRRLHTSVDSNWAGARYSGVSLGQDPYWSDFSESYYDRVDRLRKPLLDSPNYPPVED